MEDTLNLAMIEQGLNAGIIGRKILYLPSTTSTMTVIREETENGAVEGTVVIAEAQTNGRGRFNRPWISPPSCNLYLSILIRPRPDQLSHLNMAATVAVTRAIFRTTGLLSAIKWPNDIVIEKKKVAGILIETYPDSNGLIYAVIGIGINVNFDPSSYPEIASRVTSLRNESGSTISRVKVIQTLLQEIDDLYRRIQNGELPWIEWKNLLETLGQQVRVEWHGTVEEGRATDVDQEGSLILERIDGSVAVLPAGEVTFHLAGKFES